jgi:para-nitrobenzyl esterase
MEATRGLCCLSGNLGGLLGTHLLEGAPRWLAFGLGVMLLVQLGPVPAAPAAPAVVVPSRADACLTTVAEGRVAGERVGRACVYRGLRYAAAPVGSNRFRPPVPAPRWSGTRYLSQHENFACPRVAPNVTESYRGAWPSSTDEDCLRAAVTTPAEPGRDRPVLVYLHGGAFLSGSGFQSDFNARRLANRGDAVVVSINYRLGVFGYLELGALDSSVQGSGNNGLRDQIAALRWVRKNAESFGGDPRNITVIGESAGAISISAMLAGRPHRLFRRAIVQSGNGYLTHTASQAREIADEVLEQGQITDLATLQRMTVPELLDLQSDYLERHSVQKSTLFAPYVDGQLLPGNVTRRLRQGSARGIDLLIGSNRDEAMFFALDRPALVYLPAVANPFFPEELRAQQPQMIATYGQTLPAGGQLPGRRGTTLTMLTDQLFRIPAIRMAEAHRRWHRNTYMYRFDWAPMAPPGTTPEDDVGAMHTLELPFVFGGLRFSWVPNGPTDNSAELAERRRLSTQMMRAWLTFARTGDPNPIRRHGVPRWPTYDSTARRTMLWSDEPSIRARPQDLRRAAWDDYEFAHLKYSYPVG